MAEESAKLRIPYIAAAQAQKHVTHNEGVTLLDTLVQLSVLDKDLTDPPGSPTEGDTYIVAGAGGSGTGAWLGWDKRVARYIDGEWRSYLPGQGDGAGWLAWVLDEDTMYRFDGTGWDAAGIEGPQGVAGPAGSDGADGADGMDGQSFEPDAVVALIAGRDAYDDEAAAFSVLVVADSTNGDQSTLYFKLSAGSADWSDPITWGTGSGAGGGRELLDADRTYYVDGGAGSDSNDGLSSGAGAFATLAKAMSVVGALDLNIYDVTVQLASGTYAGAALPTLSGSGVCRIIGDTTTPTNVELDNAGGGSTGALIGGGAANPFMGKFEIRGVYFNDASDVAIYLAGSGAYLQLYDVDFGPCNHHIRSTNGAVVNLIGDYTISGGAGRHLWAETVGVIREEGAHTVTLTGTPDFSSDFADCRELSMMRHTGWTFSGAATGSRYDVSSNSVIQTAGGGASYFPGDSAGSDSEGGLYT